MVRYLALLLAGYLPALATDYYVDPDWGGTESGTQAEPWADLAAAKWTTINTALASDNVNIYLSALETDGVTQESQAWFIECRRDTDNANRLTIDGHAKYNTDDATPSWSNNPFAIATAYKNNQVFELTGDGSSALGWTRSAGISASSTVSNGGKDYLCIDSHTSAAATEPGVGANWADVWAPRGVASASAWVTSTVYHTEVKQDNITLRGFECTGSGARTTVLGDNVIVEYIWIHDITSVGPAFNTLYNSHPDTNKDIVTHGGSTYECIFAHTSGASTEPGVGADWAIYWEVTALAADSGAWATSTSYTADPRQIAASCDSITVRFFRIETVFGEAIYLGAGNPGDLIAQVDEDEFGNLNTGYRIHDGYIGAAGVGGGQGDGIDCKNGLTDLQIYDVEFDRAGNDDDASGAIILPQSYVDTDQNIVIERCYIHDSTTGTVARAIYGISSTHAEVPWKGYRGIDIRNNIIDTMKKGINISSTGETHDIRIYNNTFYNVTEEGLTFGMDSGGDVKNNIIVDCNSGGNQVSMSGTLTSDFNGHSDTWGYGSEGGNTVAWSAGQVSGLFTDGAGGDFTLQSGAAARDIGTDLISVGVVDDYILTSRPQNATFDTGAYEFIVAPAAANTGVRAVLP